MVAPAGTHCEFKCKYKHLLNLHLAGDHGIGEVTWHSCTATRVDTTPCDFKTKSYSTLRVHALKLHGIELPTTRRYACMKPAPPLEI